MKSHQTTITFRHLILHVFVPHRCMGEFFRVRTARTGQRDRARAPHITTATTTAALDCGTCLRIMTYSSPYPTTSHGHHHRVNGSCCCGFWSSTIIIISILLLLLILILWITIEGVIDDTLTAMRLQRHSREVLIIVVIVIIIIVVIIVVIIVIVVAVVVVTAICVGI